MSTIEELAERLFKAACEAKATRMSSCNQTGRVPDVNGIVATVSNPFDSLFDEVKDHYRVMAKCVFAELESAQKACAEMRGVLGCFQKLDSYISLHESFKEPWEELVEMTNDALSTDCGKDYVPKSQLESAQQRIAELENRVSDQCIRGMLTRLEREHNELRAAWENETGKPWVATEALENEKV